jgi:hypothetical protein
MLNIPENMPQQGGGGAGGGAQRYLCMVVLCSACFVFSPRRGEDCLPLALAPVGLRRFDQGRLIST